MALLTPEFQAALQTPDVVSLDALEGAVIGNLPPHLQSAWHSLCEHDPNAAVWFGETVADLELELIKRMRREVVQVLVGKELRDQGFEINALEARG